MQKQRRLISCGLAAVAGLAMAGHGATQGAKAAGNVIDEVTRCRSQADDRDRLTCYDSAIDQLTSAQRNNDITVLTREELTEQRRALFGLAVADDRLFERRTAKLPRIETLDSRVGRVAMAGRDTFTVVLEDKSVWRTIEAARIAPKTGDTVHIRRAALGSFLGSFNGTRSVRIERVR